MGQPLIDELGHRYGALLVIDKAKKNGKTAWLC